MKINLESYILIGDLIINNLIFYVVQEISEDNYIICERDRNDLIYIHINNLVNEDYYLVKGNMQ